MSGSDAEREYEVSISARADACEGASSARPNASSALITACFSSGHTNNLALAAA
jgi:hypothetical protein